jgi:hypothetical protein
MKYTANCPACAEEFEINGIASARAGLNCPKCGTGFVPDKVHRSSEKISSEPASPEPLSTQEIIEFSAQIGLEKRRKQIQNAADFFVLAAGIFLFFAIIAFGLAIYKSIVEQSGDWPTYLGASCVGISLWLYLIGQIIHIRANTEK